MQTSTNNQTLYDHDYALWLDSQVRALKSKNYQAIDLGNLIEEIEDMGKREKRSLESYVKLLIQHIFKLQYWQTEKDWNEEGWRLEVVNFRTEIQSILRDSPSLKGYLEANYLHWYQQTGDKTNKSKAFLVPEHQPIPLDTILDDEFFGGITF